MFMSPVLNNESVSSWPGAANFCSYSRTQWSNLSNRAARSLVSFALWLGSPTIRFIRAAPSLAELAEYLNANALHVENPSLIATPLILASALPTVVLCSIGPRYAEIRFHRTCSSPASASMHSSVTTLTSSLPSQSSSFLALRVGTKALRNISSSLSWVENALDPFSPEKGVRKYLEASFSLSFVSSASSLLAVLFLL